MEQKMKRCLCLMLSFVFAFSNYTQLFAQTVPTAAEQQAIKAGATVPEELLTKAMEDMSTVRSSLDKLKFYADKVLKESQFATIDLYDMKRYSRYLKEVEELYPSVVNRTLAYNKYLNAPWLDGTGGVETIIGRTAREYTYKAPRLVVNNRYALEEGATIRAIREEVSKVVGPQSVNYAANTAKIQEKVKIALNFLEERIDFYDHMLKGNVRAQEVLAGRVDQLIAEGVITRERIIDYVVENMNPEELRFIEVLKEVKAGGLTSDAIKKSLIRIAAKKAKSPMLGLMRNVSYETLKSKLTPKTKKFIKNFPELLEEGNTTISSRIAKRGLKVGPIAVISALLTAALITEVRNDNHFGVETVSNSRLANIQRSIDKGIAGDADEIMFYSHPQSDGLTEKDTKHFIKSITLAMNLEEAEKNFDMIDNILSEEALALSNEGVNEELQNKLDEQLLTITDKVLQDVGMI
ncbi:MAG: hypothetical protein J5594_05655 [Elusimicrobiaceae bacterium]|nr:hypothetical protein [Elusimicrobiaceae bacterium]